jgi:hypothetical protein
MHSERIKLWEEFNTAWLSALQTQKEMSLEMLDTGQRPHPPRSLMESDQMESMGKELVRLCDIMEKHGLVDYQMGVWEEEIVSRKCLTLQQHIFRASSHFLQSSTPAWNFSKSKARALALQPLPHPPGTNGGDDAVDFI